MLWKIINMGCKRKKTEISEKWEDLSLIICGSSVITNSEMFGNQRTVCPEKEMWDQKHIPCECSFFKSWCSWQITMYNQGARKKGEVSSRGILGSIWTMSSNIYLWKGAQGTGWRWEEISILFRLINWVRNTRKKENSEYELSFHKEKQGIWR